MVAVATVFFDVGDCLLKSTTLARVAASELNSRTTSSNIWCGRSKTQWWLVMGKDTNWSKIKVLLMEREQNLHSFSYIWFHGQGYLNILTLFRNKELITFSSTDEIWANGFLTRIWVFLYSCKKLSKFQKNSNLLHEKKKISNFSAAEHVIQSQGIVFLFLFWGNDYC